VQPTARPDDLVTPGHVFPIRARNGGVLVRTGQTEGSVDLARLAGLDPSGVICEIMNVDGTMARRPELEAFAAEHGLLIVSIAELVQYRYAHDQLVEKVSERRVRHRRWGDLRVVVTRSRLDGSEQLALVKGDVGGVEPPLVRVQALDTPADLVNLVLGAGGAEFDAAMQAIEREGRGVFVYLPRTSPGARMSDRVARLEAGPGMAPGYHRVGSRLDLREFGTGAQILRMLGVRRFRVLSNHDIRIVGLEGFDLELVERVPLPVEAAFALVDDGRSEA
jgi:3,4-dihydroxy 2-butanone 4-phosphate synthase/GTP cyclohydrolase II